MVKQSTLALLMYFESRGLWDEGIATFSQAASALDEHTPAGARAVGAALRALTAMHYRRGQMAEAEAAARRALRLARRQGEHQHLKVCLNHIGLCLWNRGHFADSLRFFEQALKRALTDGEPYFYPAYTGNIAMAQNSLGHLAQALLRFREAVALHRGQHNLRGMVIQLYNTANVLDALGEPHAAEPLMREALAVCEQQGLTALHPLALLGLGVACTALGRHAEANGLLLRSLAETRTRSESRLESLALRAVARCAIAQGSLQAAAEHLAALQALDLAEPEQLGCLMVHGAYLAAAGRPERAVALWRWLTAQPMLPGDDRHRTRQLLTALDPQGETAHAAIAATPTLPEVWTQARRELMS